MTAKVGDIFGKVYGRLYLGEATMPWTDTQSVIILMQEVVARVTKLPGPILALLYRTLEKCCDFHQNQLNLILLSFTEHDIKMNYEYICWLKPIKDDIICLLILLIFMSVRLLISFLGFFFTYLEWEWQTLFLKPQDKLNKPLNIFLSWF